MIPNYKHVAFYYDWLAKIVFGHTVEQAKKSQLKLIRENYRVLIVGGGTGKILHYLDTLELPLEIDFVDASAQMLKWAKTKQLTNIHVRFKNIDIMDHIKPGYDVVITNFFFDQYSYEQSIKYLRHLKSLMKKSAMLFCADYVVPVRIKDRLVIWLMYRFFRVVINLPKIQLFNIEKLILDHDFEIIRYSEISPLVFSGAFRLAGK